MTEYEEWQNTPGRLGILVSKGDFKERRMAGKRNQNINFCNQMTKKHDNHLLAMSVNYTFDGLARRIITDITVANERTKETKTAAALWDTGATCSFVSKETAYALGLKPYRKEKVSGAFGNEKECEVARAGFQVDANGFIEVDAVIDDLRDSDCIIGMDIISRMEITIKPKDGNLTFSFSYPPAE